MNTLSKVGLFAVALVALFGVSAALGDVVGPVDTDPEPSHSGHQSSMGNMPGMGQARQTPGGLQVAQDGYRLVLDKTSVNPSPSATVSFTILGPAGRPLREYARLHDKELHLIVVKRDLSRFQHVHPTRDDHGTWSAKVALTPGQWRVFADFDPAGDDDQLTLGADLTVPGSLDPRPLPAASRTARVDGYVVTLRGDVVAGVSSKLTLDVAKDGVPVTDLQPYLAAYGHLVALREGDLAYLHVHPDGEPGDGRTEPGPSVTFYAEAPSVGRYRLYLDFKHDGVVRTAEFTVNATETTSGSEGAGHDDH